MKLYLLSQATNLGYDTFDSVVVAARDEKEARGIHPYNLWHHNPWAVKLNVWANSPDEVDAEYIGEAKEGTAIGPILSSFNAG